MVTQTWSRSRAPASVRVWRQNPSLQSQPCSCDDWRRKLKMWLRDTCWTNVFLGFPAAGVGSFAVHSWVLMLKASTEKISHCPCQSRKCLQQQCSTMGRIHHLGYSQRAVNMVASMLSCTEIVSQVQIIDQGITELSTIQTENKSRVGFGPGELCSLL